MAQSKKLKAVVITGASSGIGESCALWLEKRGMRVFAGVRKGADAMALSRKGSPLLTPLLLDVADQKSIEAATQAISRKLKTGVELDLVNNAGVTLGGPIEYISLDDLRKELEVNLIGSLAVTQALLPLIRESGGRIVNMSSVSGLISYPFLGPYSASKFALEAISDALRIELRPWGISVSLIEPGDVDTPIWDKSQTMIDHMTRHWPTQAFKLYGPVMTIQDKIRRHGISPNEVAKVVEHALTDRHSRPRYRVGKFAPIIDLFRHLPIAVRDRIIAYQLPKYGDVRVGALKN
jgi:NAD(P)-dependent dehydrogenase (short-subunit alcohol dehydrogenase family)